MGSRNAYSAPQALGWCIGLHPDHVLFVDAGVAEAGKMRLLRRANDNEACAGRDDRAQGRTDQAPLQHRGLRAQDLRDRLARPTMTRQLGVESRKASGND